MPLEATLCSALASRSVPGLLPCSSATLVLWPWLLPSLNSHFLCFSSRMRPSSVDISLSLSLWCPVRPGGAWLSRSHYTGPCLPLARHRHVTTHQSCGTKNIASNNIGSQSAQHRRADGQAQEAKSRCWASTRLGPWSLSSALAAVTGHVSRERVKT